MAETPDLLDSRDQPPDPRVSILLVDDEPANLLSLEAILHDLGHNLVRARSGAEAAAQFLKEEFALVLLDVQMPGVDGLETAKLLRARAAGARTPIIFLTAFDSESFQVERAYSLGAVDYLVKPLSPVILKAKVAGFVELFEKTRQVKRQADVIRRMERRSLEGQLAEENARLRESEARKTAILETALDCIITIDQKGKITEFNPAAERLFGYSRDEALGRDIAEIAVPARLREAHRLGMAHYLATGDGPVLDKRIEMPALRKDGTEVLVELAIARIPIEGGPQFTAYLRDISERARSEARRNARLAVTQVLAQAHDVREAAIGILQAICENLGWDVGLFWTCDAEAQALRCLETWHLPGMFTDFEATSRARRFTPGQGLPGHVWVTGKPAWIFDVLHNANFPRAPIAAKEGLHGAFGCPVAAGADILGVIEFFSKTIREPDADLLEMMNTIAGQIGQFVERQRAEEALRDSERRFVRFMQHLPGLAWIKDVQGRYLYANDAAQKAFRTSRADLYGKTDEQLFPPETAAQFTQNDQKALESAAGIQVIETLADEKGDLRRSIVSKFPIIGPEGDAVLVGGMAIDITERLRAEEALKEAGRLKDEFLAMLAHELRNPLAPIRNALDVIKQPGANGAIVQQVRDIAERQVQHMARLLDDLLDVSRISRGRIELRMEKVDVAALIGRTVEAVRPLLEERRQELTLSFPAAPLLVNADPTRLEQVLTNLLNNAAKYTDPGGRISMIAEAERGQAVLRVRDTGIGIDAAMLPRIFDLFVQAERRLDRAQGGVGIGLTLVKKLVELHGGRIEAASPGLGQGSEFIVRLPTCSDPPPPERTCATESSTSAAPRRRVLVVDDNHDAADSLALLLKLTGHEVGVAYDGPSALTQAKDFAPALVILDIGMPGMDGYEVAQRFRGDPQFDGITLIALTGWGQEEDKRRSKEAGFDHHLIKPVEPDAITRLMSSHHPRATY